MSFNILKKQINYGIFEIEDEELKTQRNNKLKLNNQDKSQEKIFNENLKYFEEKMKVPNIFPQIKDKINLK